MKTVCRSFLCVLVVGVVATSVSFAEGEEKGTEGKRPERKRPDLATTFAGMDADQSGGVSLEEFKAHRAKRMEAQKQRVGDRKRPEGAKTPPTDEEIFSRMDADSDGVVTEEEFKASSKQHRGPRGRRGAEEKADDDKVEE